MTDLRRQVCKLLDQALDISPSERPVWLTRVCSGDPALRRELDRALAAIDRPGGILDAPVHELSLDILAEEASTREDPATLGRYRILRRLGQGGMGVVYQALDERLDRFVALKVLGVPETSSAEGRDRLLAEARAAASLEHPSLCTVYDVGEADGLPYIAMAYCEGETLAERLSRGPLPAADAVRIAMRVAEGLARAHAAGIVHRDIKPSNLMLDSEDGVKIVDFGLAKRRTAGTGLTRAGARLGTPAYMSPEQARGDEVDARTDVWSLGCVLYEMLTGSRAFPQKTEIDVLLAILGQEPPAPRSLREDIPPAVEALVRRALRKSKAERFADADEMRMELERSLGQPRAGTGTASGRRFPIPMTRLIGREREVERVRTILDSARLVTLTGPAGTGKTRLCLEVASRVAAAFADGACFVSLAGTEDPSLIPFLIARALDLAESPANATVEGLASALRDRDLLLVLDDFERVVAGAREIAVLLSHCPELKVLVTSRVVLRISGEHAFSVPPLPLPPASTEGPAESPAVALFVERARAANPGLAFDEEDMRATAEICIRLEGMPLSIELAAARTRLFAPRALLARLERRLDLLREGPRDRPARHQTLRSAIAWSYDLLSPGEQELFRRLSVFVHGCTLEAAEEITAALGDDPSSVIDCLSALVDHSLLRPVASGIPRFSMFETIREYAVERLEEFGRADDVRRVHARCFLDLSERAEKELVGPDQVWWIRRLDEEQANFRAALSWSETRGQADVALGIGAGLWRYWLARGLLQEGRARLHAALSLSPQEPTASRARALNGAATLAHNEGDNPTAHALLQEALSIRRALADEKGTAEILNNLSWVASELTSLEESEVLALEALQRNRALGETRAVAISLNNLGWVATYRGDGPAAARFFEEALETRRRLGDRRGVAFAAANLAWARINAGSYGEAEPLLDEALEALGGLNDKLLTGLVLEHRGRILFECGEEERAAALLEESLRLWRESENRSGVAWTLVILGDVRRALGRFDLAEPLLAEGLRIWDSIGGR